MQKHRRLKRIAERMALMTSLLHMVRVILNLAEILFGLFAADARPELHSGQGQRDVVFYPLLVSRRMSNIDIRFVAPGTVISVPTHIFYRHVGLVSDLRDWSGLPFIISNSAKNGGIAEETLAAFADGKAWRYENTPNRLTPRQVLYRARTCARREYHPLQWNCETFVSHCHGMPEQSPQAAATVGMVIVGLLVAGLVSGS